MAFVASLCLNLIAGGVVAVPGQMGPGSGFDVSAFRSVEPSTYSSSFAVAATPFFGSLKVLLHFSEK